MGGKTSFNSEQTKAVVEILKNIDSFKRRVPGTDVIEAPTKRILDWDLIYSRYECLRQFKTKQILKKIGCLEDIERSKVSSNYRQPWTNEELTKLFALVAKHSKVFPNGESRINFKKVSKEFGNTRSKSQLVGQYGNLTRKVSITNRKDFTQEENQKLADLFSKHNGKWNEIEKEFNNGIEKENQRTSEQLRNHHNCLYFAKTKKGAWSKEEKERLWSIVAKYTFNGITHMPAVYESFGPTRSPIQIKQQCQLTKFNEDEEVLLVELVNKHNASHLAIGSQEWSMIFKEFNSVQKSHLKRDEKLIYRLYKRSIINRLVIPLEQKNFIKDQYAKGLESDEIHRLMLKQYGSDLELIKVVNICSKIYWNIDSDDEEGEDIGENYEDNDSDGFSDESGEDLKLGVINYENDNNMASFNNNDNNITSMINFSNSPTKNLNQVNNINSNANSINNLASNNISPKQKIENNLISIYLNNNNNNNNNNNANNNNNIHPFNNILPNIKLNNIINLDNIQNNNNYNIKPSSSTINPNSNLNLHNNNVNYFYDNVNFNNTHHNNNQYNHNSTHSNHNYNYNSKFTKIYIDNEFDYSSFTTTTTTTTTSNTPRRDNQIKIIDLLNDDEKKRKSPDSNTEIINFWKKLKEVN